MPYAPNPVDHAGKNLAVNSGCRISALSQKLPQPSYELQRNVTPSNAMFQFSAHPMSSQVAPIQRDTSKCHNMQHFFSFFFCGRRIGANQWQQVRHFRHIRHILGNPVTTKPREGPKSGIPRRPRKPPGASVRLGQSDSPVTRAPATVPALSFNSASFPRKHPLVSAIYVALTIGPWNALNKPSGGYDDLGCASCRAKT